MGHAKACPHDCRACKKSGRWFTGAWLHGGCVVCGQNRGGQIWACDGCWGNLSVAEHSSAKQAISAAQKESQ